MLVVAASKNTQTSSGDAGYQVSSDEVKCLVMSWLKNKCKWNYLRISAESRSMCVCDKVSLVYHIKTKPMPLKLMDVSLTSEVQTFTSTWCRNYRYHCLVSSSDKIALLAVLTAGFHLPFKLKLRRKVISSVPLLLLRVLPALKIYLLLLSPTFKLSFALPLRFECRGCSDRFV